MHKKHHHLRISVKYGCYWVVANFRRYPLSFEDGMIRVPLGIGKALPPTVAQRYKALSVAFRFRKAYIRA